MDADRCAEIRGWIDDLDHLPDDGRVDGSDVSSDLFKCVFNRDPKWLALIDPPGVIEVVEELLVSGRVQLPLVLMTLHYYLVDVDIDLCPTWVVPGSHLSGGGPDGSRPPPGHPGTLRGSARGWRGQAPLPVLCRAGDALLFRSEVWRSGSRNQTPNRTRYLLQVHYGARGIGTRYLPYRVFRYNPDVVAASNPRQRRLIGDHGLGAYA